MTNLCQQPLVKMQHVLEVNIWILPKPRTLDSLLDLHVGNNLNGFMESLACSAKRGWSECLYGDLWCLLHPMLLPHRELENKLPYYKKSFLCKRNICSCTVLEGKQSKNNFIHGEESQGTFYHLNSPLCSVHACVPPWNWRQTLRSDH